MVPSSPARTQRQAPSDLAVAMGAPAARVSGIAWPVLSAVGVVVPLMREVVAVRHQWDGPFVVDGAETTQVLGIAPTPWDAVVAATAQAVPSATA